MSICPEEIFTRLERIGRGSFGEVYKGIDNRTAEVFYFFRQSVESSVTASLILISLLFIIFRRYLLIPFKL